MLADLLAEQGKYVDARKLISSKLESLSGIAALFMDRAQLNCRIEDFTSCVADVNKAMSIDPSPARAIAASVVLGRAIGHAPGKRNVSLMEALGTLQHMEFGPEYGLIGDLARLRIRGELFLANGSSAQAIVEFRKASQIDAPINSREYLARALIANAQHTENEASQTAMLREAQAIYAAIAFHPAVIWQFSLSTPPGFFADHLEAWLKLSDRFGDDPKRPEAIQTLKRLRPGSAELLRSDSLNPSLATKPVITLN
jgi:tetratricopeptide (TPR) repeat protein